MLARLGTVLSLRCILTCLALVLGMTGPALPDTIVMAPEGGCAAAAAWGIAGCDGDAGVGQVAVLRVSDPAGGWLSRAIPLSPPQPVPGAPPVRRAADPPRPSATAGLLLAAELAAARVDRALVALRPAAWRQVPDHAAPRRGLLPLPELASVGRRAHPALPWLAGAPGGALPPVLAGGADGPRLSDLVFLPALAQRLLMTRFYPGEMAEVRVWWGSALVPLKARAALRPLLPYPVSPFPRQGRDGDPGVPRPRPLPGLPAPAPVPLGPGGVYLAAALCAVAGLQRSRPRRRIG